MAPGKRSAIVDPKTKKMGVIKVLPKNINNKDEKWKQEAFKFAGRISGVEAVALTGEHKNEVKIVGVGLDWAGLVVRMGKELRAYTELLWLEEVDNGGGGSGSGSGSGGSYSGSGSGDGGGCVIL